MRKIIVLLLMVLLIAGCTNPAKDTIKIGLLIPTTGGLASYGDAMGYAADVAIEEINDAGGVLGKDIELVPKNTETSPDIAKTRAQELIDEDIVIIIGAAASSSTIKASEATIPNKCVLIAPPSTSPDITTLDDSDYVYRTCPSDLLQGKAMAMYIYQTLNKTDISCLYVNNTYGEGLKNVLYTQFKNLGGDTLKAVPYPDSFTTLPADSIDFMPYIDSLYSINASIVVLIAYDDGGVAVHQEATTGGDSLEWFGCDGIMTSGFLVNAGTYAENIMGTAPYHEEDTYYESFKTRYKTKHPDGTDPVVFIPNTYDAIILAALAIEKAGSNTDGALLKTSLRQIAYTGTTVRTYADAITQLNNGNDINYNGVSGNLDFDSYGDVITPYEIWKVISGSFNHQSIITP